MFLAIDAGNSNVVFALFDRKENRWKNQFRLETNLDTLGNQLSKKVPLYFLEHGIGPPDISQIGYSSVVPEINKIITDFCVNFLGKKPYLISAKSYVKLPVKTSRPQEIGTDLMCNVMAGYKKFQRPVIIVDFGTALTFTVINENGKVLGVNIVPGIKTAIKSLFSSTSKLPEVALKVPESAIGKNTIHAIQAGIFYGYSSLIKGMLETISQEAKLEFKIIATGGLSAVLTPLEKTFDEVDRNLTLEGLRLITEANT
jgi:type III pantothenate kinase